MSVDSLDLLDYLLQEELGLSSAQPERITRRTLAGPVPLSFAQQRLWTLTRLYPDNSAYTIAAAVRLHGRLDLPGLGACFAAIVQRHEVLRTCFTAADGPPLASVLPELPLPLPLTDLSALPAAQREAALVAHCAAAAATVFDPARPPLLALRLLRLATDEHVLVLALHHLIADGWSVGVLIRELGTLYSAHQTGQSAPLPELPIQYADFALWQREQQALLSAQRDYWLQQLAELPPLELPYDRRRPVQPTFAGASEIFQLSPALSERLKTLAQQHNASLFMVLLAGFMAVLARYSGQSDVAVGTGVAGRARRELEPLIGFFVNTLVLRGDLSGRPDFITLLARVRTTVLTAFEQQDLPFDQVVQALRPERELGQQPLFQVMFTLQNAPVEPLSLPGLAMTPVDLPVLTAKFDLFLAMTETAEGLGGGFEYSSELFTAATITRLSRHFVQLLEAVAAAPHCPLADLPLLDDTDAALLRTWNATERPLPTLTLVDLFEAQAARCPTAPALVFADGSLSYADLNRRANQWAQVLRAAGVGPETAVGVYLDRSAELVTVLLGILKAGGLYVPLDRDTPPTRLQQMLADSRCVALVADRDPVDGAVPLLCPAALTAERAAAPADNPRWARLPQQLAYVIYTSGSTGIPKGVAVSDAAIVRLVCNSNYLEFGPATVIAQASNVAFDAATFEIWGTLLHGGQLVGVSRDTLLNPSALAAFLREQGITALFLTTALFNQVARECPTAFATLEALLFGGEAVNPEMVRRVLDYGPPQRLLHVYGPTESTTFATFQPLTSVPDQVQTLPIGAPLSNTTAYVVGTDGKLLPPGLPGELYLGGAGLARGYLHRPELTADRFVPDPFALQPGARLYRTGDRVRQGVDGAIEFLGRVDHQVKLRGFRIEPGEIEAALLQQPQVTAALVQVREDRPGDKRLVAYVATADTDLSAAALREFLQARLPAYMVPAAFVLLPALPLNRNGKIDRNALPAPQPTEDAATVAYSPRDEREQVLVRLWTEVLGQAPTTPDADYFALGGDSIGAIQIVSRLARVGWRLDIQEVFRHPTLAALAGRLRQETATATAAPDSGPLPLLPVQRWFFATYGTLDAARQFNQSALLRASSPLDETALTAALQALWAQHPALRLCVPAATVPQGEIREPTRLALAFTVCDLRGAADAPVQLAAHADQVQASFDLAHGPLFKAVLYRCPDGERLLLVAHHLIIDAVSWHILLDDLERGYRQALVGAVDLGPRRSALVAWADWLEQRATSAELLAELPYWQQADTALDTLPITPLAPNRYGDCVLHRLALSADETAALLGTDVHHAYYTDVRDLLLTAFGLALHRLVGANRQRLLLEGHGRETETAGLDLSVTVGWFTSLFPFVLEVADGTPALALKTVKESLRRIPGKGLGYGILTQLTPPDARAGLGQHSAPTISFNYLGRFDSGAADSLFHLADEAGGRLIAAELPREQELDVVAVISDGQLALTALFQPQRLNRVLVETLLDTTRTALLQLADHCQAQPAGEKTPADFSVPLLTLAEYHALLAARAWPATAIDDLYPLSPMQEGLLFQSLYAPTSSAYQVLIDLALDGALDPERFQAAWTALCRRHAILRSVFVHEGLPRPVQVVFRDRLPALRVIDCRNLDEAAQQARIQAERDREQALGFVLDHSPPMRLTLLQFGATRWHLLWSYHHLLLDGWCLGILQQELGTLLHALTQGQVPALPPTAPYGDYIRWLEQQDRAAAQAYWAEQLAGYEQTTGLPGAAGATTFCYGDYTFELPNSAALKALAAAHGVTLNTLIRCLWGVLLGRYNGVDDVLFGAIVSGRPATLPGVEATVGLFINAVPVRLRLPPTLPFSALLHAAQQQALTAEPYQYYPLADIQAQSSLGRALFDHLLVFENYPVAADTAETTGFASALAGVHDRTHYDFDLIVVPGEQIVLRFQYNSTRYDPAQIASTARHLQTLAQCVLANPLLPLARLSLLPAAEQTLLASFNPQAQYPVTDTLPARFAAQVRATPEAIALVVGSQRLSYRQLNRHANRLAAQLQALGVGAETLVGVYADRSAELVIALLAVLKAGGAYVPLDPAVPAARLAFMLEDTGLPVLLAEAAHLAELPPTAATVVPLAPLDGTDPGADWDDDPPLALHPAQVAYVIYTSGSTGTPKGVAVTHANVLRLFAATEAQFGFNSADVWTLFHSYAFDFSVWELWGALLYGGRLVVVPYWLSRSPADFYDLLADEGVTVLNQTPSAFRQLLRVEDERQRPLALRWVIFGGEALEPASLRPWTERHGLTQPTLVNMYGITETTVHVTERVLTAADLDTAVSPVGGPLSDLRVYLLDRHGEPVPVGVPGELHVGGAGLARGYLRRPALTAARFVPDPFGSEPGARLYRSGDLARWRENGDLEYLGRIDDQVKLRGFRIELGEITAVLAAHPQVREALVVLRGSGEAQRLVAYLVADAAVPVTELREFLRARLPEYMLPAAFVFLERLPLTGNGKVDRRALPEPDADSTPTVAYVAPATALEQRLAAIWAEVLGRERVGRDDDFFAIGGHSLKAMQVVARIQRVFQIKLPVRALFEQPTLARLAEAVRAGDRSTGTALTPAPRMPTYPLSPAQQRLWLQERLAGAGVAYNMPEALAFSERLDRTALRRALAVLATRHEALRTAFHDQVGSPYQTIAAEVTLELDEIDLGSTPDAETQARILADQMAYAPFDLAQAPLARVLLLRLPSRDVLLLVMHHIIGDGWSLTVFYQELLALYQAFSAGRDNPLPPPRLQYKDYAWWQQQRDMSADAAYWLRELAQLPDGIALPYDVPPTGQSAFRGGMERLVLPLATVTALHTRARAAGTTLAAAVLALFLLVLYRSSRQSDLCVGVASAGRNHPDLENLLGFFVNLLPVRVQARADMEFDELLAQVGSKLQGALAHQDYPFDRLVQQLNPARYGNRQALINVVYGFQNFTDLRVVSSTPQAASGILAGVSAYELTLPTAKFDLTLFAEEQAGELMLNLEYDSGLFRPDTARRLLGLIGRFAGLLATETPAS